MINVMVNVVMFEKEYEFRLDSEAEISELIDEIAEMVSRKEQCQLNTSGDGFVLFSKDYRMILPLNSTLRECKIRTGDTLYFA